MRGLLIIAAAAGATLACSAGSAAGQTVDWRYSSMIGLRAQVCVAQQFEQRCTKGLRTESFSNLVARPSLVIRLEATCEWGDVEPTVEQGEVNVSFRRAGAWPTGGGLHFLCGETDYTGQATGEYVQTKRINAGFPVPVGPNGARRYPVTVTWAAGELVGGAEVVVRRSKYQPRRWRTIWDSQFDDYINVCINGGERVWASGGRLYCRAVTREARAKVAVLVR